MIDQPRAASARPKLISGRSWSSPGAHARTARRACRVGPAASKAEQPAAQQIAREMLLRDARLSPLPATTEVGEVRKHHVAQHRLEPERREQTIECRVRRRLVESSPARPRARPPIRSRRALPVPGSTATRSAPATARRAASAADSPASRCAASTGHALRPRRSRDESRPPSGSAAGVRTAAPRREEARARRRRARSERRCAGGLCHPWHSLHKTYTYLDTGRQGRYSRGPNLYKQWTEEGLE